MASKISRHKAREQAFIILFESIFNDDSITELIGEAEESLDIAIDEYAVFLINNVKEKTESIDVLFEKHLKSWSKTRISKVSLTILRIAVFEMFFCDEVPDSAAINEAIELMKEYADPKDASFVNGVLGSVSREKTSQNKLKPEDN